MRIDAGGRLIYANPASRGLLRALGARRGRRLRADDHARIAAAAEVRGSVEVVAGARTFALWPVHIGEFDFTNVYGVDVTAERAIVKFPNQNPNPVFRTDRVGCLIYANPASEGLIAGLGLALGDRIPAELHGALRGDGTGPVEVESGGRTYALVAVDVPEFGFLNVYGTDVTSERERARLAAENERLLLNILPEPIARRLREGETIIADRFDDVTLLFADIVDFTQMSARMAPSELVAVLNDVFTAFESSLPRMASRRSRRSVTRTWWSAESRRGRRITSSGSPRWPSTLRVALRGSSGQRGWVSHSGSGSTAGRSWQG